MSRRRSVQRYWAVPGLLDRQLAALDVGGSVLGGLASSRLDKVLVRDEKLAVGRGRAASTRSSAIGIFNVRRYAKPGRRPGDGVEAARRDDRRLYRQGTDRRRGPARGDERSLGRIRGLEQVGGFGGKAVTLAEGQTFADDSNFYKKTLDRLRRDHAGGGPHGDAALADPAAADDHALARRPSGI